MPVVTEDGFVEGGRALAQVEAPAAAYIEQVVAWVKARNFKSLVSAIYAKYPEMKANTIFRE